MNELNNNGSRMSLSQALNIIKNREVKNFDSQKVNLAELQRLTGITKAKLRRLKKNGFVEKKNGNKGRKSNGTVLAGYTSVFDNFLKNDLTNSQVCYEWLIEFGSGEAGARFGHILPDTSILFPWFPWQEGLSPPGKQR